jgi:hypothetical protein
VGHIVEFISAVTLTVSRYNIARQDATSGSTQSTKLVGPSTMRAVITHRSADMCHLNLFSRRETAGKAVSWSRNNMTWCVDKSYLRPLEAQPALLSAVRLSQLPPAVGAAVLAPFCQWRSLEQMASILFSEKLHTAQLADAPTLHQRLEYLIGSLASRRPIWMCFATTRGSFRTWGLNGEAMPDAIRSAKPELRNTSLFGKHFAETFVLQTLLLLPCFAGTTRAMTEDYDFNLSVRPRMLNADLLKLLLQRDTLPFAQDGLQPLRLQAELKTIGLSPAANGGSWVLIGSATFSRQEFERRASRIQMIALLIESISAVIVLAAPGSALNAMRGQTLSVNYTFATVAHNPECPTPTEANIAAFLYDFTSTWPFRVLRRIDLDFQSCSTSYVATVAEAINALHP